MSNSFSFVIRDALEDDIAACRALDHSYETDYVWQMSIQPELTLGYTVAFRTERLPHPLEVNYPSSDARLHLSLAAEHCYVVVVGRDEPDILAYLTMRQDAVHRLGIIQDIVVSRPFRRRRIGVRLLRIARQWATEQNLERILIEVQTRNYPAIQFCQKAGLTFCGYNDQYFQNHDIAVFFGQALR